jgi:ribosome maturation protein Sdo1
MSTFIYENCVTPALQEEFSDMLDSWYGTVERKLKGYSTQEIDTLAKAAKEIDSEVKKRSTLERIEDALKDARIEVNKTNNADKKRELRLQIQVLGELKGKVNAFKVVEVKEAPAKAPKNTLNLDER